MAFHCCPFVVEW